MHIRRRVKPVRGDARRGSSRATRLFKIVRRRPGSFGLKITGDLKAWGNERERRAGGLTRWASPSLRFSRRLTDDNVSFS